MRADVVIITCGDTDLGERFDCSSIRVTSVSGAAIGTVRYRSGPSAYRNALGATWTARTVEAVYRAQDLRNGFTVRYTGTDGTQYTYEVTAGEAADSLLLAFQPGFQSPVQPPPPYQLRLRFSANGDMWRITNPDTYRWRGCIGEVGTSKVTLPTLEPNGAAIIQKNDFKPPLAPDAQLAMLTVTCAVGTNSWLVSASGNID